MVRPIDSYYQNLETEYNALRCPFCGLNNRLVPLELVLQRNLYL